MDPRFKMQFVDFSFAKIFGDEAASYNNIVDEGIHQLFLDYAVGGVIGHLSNGDGHGLGLIDFEDFSMESATSELKKDFSRLDTLYPDYFKSPSGEDWNLVDNLCTYLKLIFDTATVVMDPQFKMQLVDFSFAKIFGDEAASYINIVDEGIHRLFLDYVAGDVTGHLSNGDGHGLGLTD
nr:zinc finger BED domain-containing protein DAYSLEEPER-like [Tanacetum cinerariifolium]